MCAPFIEWLFSDLGWSLFSILCGLITWLCLDRALRDRKEPN